MQKTPCNRVSEKITAADIKISDGYDSSTNSNTSFGVQSNTEHSFFSVKIVMDLLCLRLLMVLELKPSLLIRAYVVILRFFMVSHSGL